MKTITLRRRCPAYRSYRAARVRSLFNVTAEQGATFEATARVPIDEFDWRIGLIVGPSGSGKSTLASRIFGPGAVHRGFEWGRGPIIDAIAPRSDFNDVAAALSAVGLGSCPSWLRPFHVLSVGERFRAELARLLIESGERIVVDEFTSALDRQVARIAAGAFSRAWRRRAGQIVLATCHRDVARWLAPDWVFDTSRWRFARRLLRRRPPIELVVRRADWSAWKMFEPHHYLKLPPMAFGHNYIGTVDGEPVVHVGAATTCGVKSVRLCRLVVMPEWQGAGVGLAFLNHLAERFYRGRGRWRHRMTSIIHTSHPGLSAALRRDPRWVVQSMRLLGEQSDRSSAAGRRRYLAGRNVPTMGGHLRSVIGFRYVGSRR